MSLFRRSRTRGILNAVFAAARSSQVAVSRHNSGSGETTGDSKDSRGRVFVFEDFELRAGSCELLRSGCLTDLQLKPSRLLLYLVDNRDRVVTKTELLDQIWPDANISESAFNTTISEIRRVLGDHGDTQRFLRTRQGRGYQFVAQVTVGAPASEASSGSHPGQPSPTATSTPRQTPRSAHTVLRAVSLALGVSLTTVLAGLVWQNGAGPTENPVTTRSTRALGLYTQANEFPTFNHRAREELLREAVREDPEFASAYALLAWAVANQARPSEEYVRLAERAVELADSATEPERLFARGTHSSLLGEHRKALANYQALLSRSPCR